MANNTLPKLPAVPFVGLEFIPDTTDSVGTIVSVKSKKVKGKLSHDVTYTYRHAPEVKHTRPYREVVSMAWPLNTH